MDNTFVLSTAYKWGGMVEGAGVRMCIVSEYIVICNLRLLSHLVFIMVFYLDYMTLLRHYSHRVFRSNNGLCMLPIISIISDFHSQLIITYWIVSDFAFGSRIYFQCPGPITHAWSF